ncbi:MAG TPA: hypothetical protein DEG09_13000 [Marinilabiliaceae bacterium]|nr:hypothetical protein [Marinilabiliaceae bacterium]HBX89519.1 hypothetical protein [Marinilabiliaceae bacterium]
MKRIIYLAVFALISANAVAQEVEPVQEQNRKRVENRVQNQEALQAGEAIQNENPIQERQRLHQPENAGQAGGNQTAAQARARRMDGTATAAQRADNRSERALENRNRAIERRAAAQARNEARRQNEGMRESARERQQARPQTPAGEGQSMGGSQRKSR